MRASTIPTAQPQDAAGPGGTRRPRTATPRRQTAEVRRDAILDAAVVEFAAHGLHGTATEAIARRAGVSQPYVFRLFGTKKALFLAAVDRGHQRVLTTFRNAADEAARGGGEPFAAMGLAYVGLLADRDELMLSMQSFAACGDPEVAELVRRRFGEVTEFVAAQPGATDELVRMFMAEGMLLNVAAAINLPTLVHTEKWARMCLGAMPEFLTDKARTPGETTR
jgi:AcrR family transcriptional regulator